MKVNSLEIAQIELDEAFEYYCAPIASLKLGVIRKPRLKFSLLYQIDFNITLVFPPLFPTALALV